MNAPICPIHQCEATWREGVSKKTNKPYGFWSCSQRMPDGGYCISKFNDAAPGNLNQPMPSQTPQVAPQSSLAPQTKDEVITKLAIAKSCIERGYRFNDGGREEANLWLNWCKGQSAADISESKDEINTEDIPF